MEAGQSHALELDSTLLGCTVIARDEEPVGEVAGISLDRNCLLVAKRNLIGRKKEHPIHRSAIDEIDVDAMTITIAATRDQVEEAPDFDDLDQRCAEDVAHYYAQVRQAL